MHRNNFDFLRLAFALFVIITHAYALTGLPENDWLAQITRGQTSFSDVGVSGFFVISGFLVFQSLLRSNNPFEFYWRRFLRIYPGLLVMLLLTVLLAPFVYQYPLKDYFTDRSVLGYIPKNMSVFKLQYNINGVFENNPFPNVINGSLWTLPYEISIYLLLSVSFLMRGSSRLLKVILICLFILLTAGSIFFLKDLSKFILVLNMDHFFHLAAYFLAGSVLAVFGIENFRHKRIVIYVAVLLLVIALYFSVYEYAKHFLLPLLIICFGLSATRYVSGIGGYIGDLSYGLYIYAFPVQQTLVHFFELNYLELMLVSFLVTLVFAYFSWHVVEKNALKLKNYSQVNLVLHTISKKWNITK
jgi:peptidoglycan/LPS O-acetylase OafA/YrhL